MISPNPDIHPECHDLALETVLKEADRKAPQSSTTGGMQMMAGWNSHLRRGLAALLLLIGCGLLFSAFMAPQDLASESEAASHSAGDSPATASPAPPPVFRPIEEVQVGNRVAGKNPHREEVWHVTPDPKTWRKISLHLTKERGHGLSIELLRPLDWIEGQNARPGSTIFIDLPEMGAVGDAEVMALGPCPEIKLGEGTVVTGTFKHQADESSGVLNLHLEDQLELTGVTANHPYWSEDRQDFVEAGHLQPGELVDTLYGHKRVISITPVQHNGYLYNLETTEHVYRVGSLGTLVHNDCLGYAKEVLRRRKNGAIIEMRPIGQRLTGELPGYPVAGRHGMRDQVTGYHHYFHLEKGLLRDPAFPRGIQVEDWVKEYSRLNHISPDKVLDNIMFLPYLP